MVPGPRACDAMQGQFLLSLDLKEFVRIFNEEGITLDDLRESSALELKVRVHITSHCVIQPADPRQEMGIPSGARKKIIAALHPELMLN